MIPQVILGTCLAVGAVVSGYRQRRRNRRSSRSSPTTPELSLSPPVHVGFHRDLQQLFEIASTQPRLLLTNRVRAKIQRLTRRINEANVPLPWQLAYIYHQMESAVDSLSYDELYDLFGGNPTTPGLTQSEAKCLESCVYHCVHKCGPNHQEICSDEQTCPICLEAYVEGDRLLVLPSCKHKYHTKCIVQWLRLRGDCPICRRRIKDEIKSAKRIKRTILSQ
eukprot:g2528.t1